MTTPETLDPVAYERRGFYHILHGRLEGLGLYPKEYIAEQIRRYEAYEASSENPMGFREELIKALELLFEE